MNTAAQEIKRCFKCSRVKPLDDFYRHPRMGDGHLNKCKECAKRDVFENRMSNLEYYREYDRGRGCRATPESIARRRRLYPEKERAQSAVHRAVKDGRLKRPDTCSRCNEETTLHGHHEDYSKPLEVVWLCPACHKERHRELGWGYVWNYGK